MTPKDAQALTPRTFEHIVTCWRGMKDAGRSKVAHQMTLRWKSIQDDPGRSWVTAGSFKIEEGGRRVESENDVTVEERPQKI